MRRLSTIAALSAGLLLPLPLPAQFRAAPDSAAFGSARMLGGFVSPRPMRGPVRTGPVGPRPGRPGPSRPAPIPPRPVRPGPFRPAPFGGRWGRFAPQSFSQPQFTFIAPLFFPYGGYPPSPADYEPAQGPAEEPAAPETAAAPAQDDSLANQVGALTDEVEELRQQQESRESAQSGAQAQAESQPAVEEGSAPAVFVYRDGQQFEAQNYAVLGEMLWIYEDGITRKIPLARLDLDQTRKLNDERGIDFSEMR
jgi:hypothetical protein